LQLFGLNGAFLTGDLFNLFVFFEVLLLASYGLILHGGGRLRARAGLHYVVLNLAGSSLFLIAVGTLYGLFGTLNMADLASRWPPYRRKTSARRAPPACCCLRVRAEGRAVAAVSLAARRLCPDQRAGGGAVRIMTKVGAYSILRVSTLIFGAQAGGWPN
jgi:multicomponent K+:H+ antiporter subunit D